MNCGAQSRFWLFAGLLLAACLSGPSSTFAQEKKGVPRAKVPQPEDITVETDDVELHCTYYPSARGKEAVPVILIHDWESRRTELDALAKYLQAEGEHAVLVPDLRGHGESNIRKVAPGTPAENLTPATLTDIDIVKMASTDFVYLKNEMITRHNAGEFNIDLLTLVGLELGANVALHWAAVDWSQPKVAVRLGHDVKALVLVSPQSVFKKLRITNPLNVPAVRAFLSVMTVGGTNDKDMKTELSRIHNALAKYHREPKQMTGESDEEFAQRRRRKKDYYPIEKDTILQGLELVSAPNLNVASNILGFINLRVVERRLEKDLPEWEGDRRKDPVPR